MAVVKWRFDDLTNSTFVVFDINPNAGGSPQLQKTITTQSTVAPGGKTLIFQGADAVPQITFSGTILTQTQYDLYVTWFNKSHQLKLTDDLGRVTMIMITQFQPQRVYQASRPYYHTFTVTAMIVNWP